MQAPDRDPRNRTRNRHGHDRGHRQRSSLQEGPRVRAWLGVVPGEHSSGGKQQMTGTSRRGNKYFAKALRTGSTYRAAAENEAIFRPEYVAGQSRRTQAQTGGDGGISQQDGTH